jgi:dUTP pyrophosphatase
MFTQPNLLVKKLHPDAKLPTRGTSDAAGYDLYAMGSGVIAPGQKALVKTGIAVRMPNECVFQHLKVYGSIRSRSGLSVKNEIEVGAGVIDLDYCQEVGVVLRNHGDKPFEYAHHSRIAQLVLEVHVTPDVKEVEELPDRDNDRVGGFGSTGI